MKIPVPGMWFDLKYIFWMFIVSILIIIGFGFLANDNIDQHQTIQAMQSSCDQVKDENSNLQRRLDSSATALSQVQSALQVKEGELAAVSTNLSVCETVKANAAAAIVKQDEIIAALNQEIATARADLAIANTYTTQAQADRDAAVSKLDGLQAQLDQAILERDANRQKYDDAIQKAAQLEAENAALRQQVQVLTEELQTPALVRLLKATLAYPDNLPDPLYLTLGLLIGGVASTAGLALIVRKPGSKQKPNNLRDDVERRFYHEVSKRQRRRL